MSAEDLVEMLEELPPELAHAIGEMSISRREMRIEVERNALAQVAAFMRRRLHARLLSEHGSDERDLEGCFRVHVVLDIPDEDEVIILSSRLDAHAPTYPALTPVFYAADWYGREMQDMFGIVAIGHPDLRPLYLYDDWPEGMYPLRKDFDAGLKVGRAPRAYRYHKVEGEGVMEVPVGPIHAGVIEPGHFRFSVAGESVINLELRLGYAHRGVEKISESMPYAHGVRLAERISGDNGMAHSTAYCMALEQAASADIPERAGHIRTVFLEMERLYNHLGDIGGIALDTAFGTGAQMAFIMRERLLDMNDRLTGSRLLRGICVPGGVRIDIAPGDMAPLRSHLVSLNLDLRDWMEMVTTMPSFLDRVERTGILSYEAAVDLNVVGPAARASGVMRDVRKEHPYAAYADMAFSVPTRREGDVNARMWVKLEEIQESISIIDQALGSIPPGDLRAAVGPAEGTTSVALVESPRGETLHWLQCGDGRPRRHKVRDASFCNWPALEVAIMGNIVPDFPLINKSFSLSYAGDDL
jgi:Ni,Fe-hydrogenase III large subunit/Ni,Fe-hydrogenase III component G